MAAYQNKYANEMPDLTYTGPSTKAPLNGPTVMGDVENLLERTSKLGCLLRMAADTICGSEPRNGEDSVSPAPECLAHRISALGNMLNEAERHAQRLVTSLGAR